jgi:hypothetical protein
MSMSACGSSLGPGVFLKQPCLTVDGSCVESERPCLIVCTACCRHHRLVEVLAAEAVEAQQQLDLAFEANSELASARDARDRLETSRRLRCQ